MLDRALDFERPLEDRLTEASRFFLFLGDKTGLSLIEELARANE